MPVITKKFKILQFAHIAIEKFLPVSKFFFIVAFFIEQKSNPNLHTQKNFVICDIVFVIFVDHSFVERARARSARAPKISSAFLNLGARSARDF